MTAAPAVVKQRVPGEDDGEAPRFLRFEDFRKQCGQAIEYVPGLEPYAIKGGFILVIGAPKSGKSFWAGWLGATVASLGLAVLFVEEEGPCEVTRDRVLPHMTPEGARNLYIAHRTGFRLDNKREVDSLIVDAKARGAVLIILDPLVQLHSFDENEQVGVAVALHAIQRIIRETGAAVVLVHHTRKGASWNKTDDSEAQSSDARGSGALVGSADSVISIKSVPRDERRPGEVRFWVENTDTRVGAPFDKRLAIVKVAGGPDAMTFQAPESKDAKPFREEVWPLVPAAPDAIAQEALIKAACMGTNRGRSAIKYGLGTGALVRVPGKGGGLQRRNGGLVRESPSQSATTRTADSDSIGRVRDESGGESDA